MSLCKRRIPGAKPHAFGMGKHGVAVLVCATGHKPSPPESAASRNQEYEEYAEEFKEMINKVENKQDVLEKLNAIEELWKISL